MKRVNRRLDFDETGRYVINDVSENYYYKYYKEQEGEFVKVTHLSSYQICNLYTNKNTPIEAYLMLNGERASYKMVFDHQEKRLNWKNSKSVTRVVNANPKYNCHGLTFLDRMFWLELNNDKLETILTEDNFKETTLENLKEGGVALYYNKKGNIHHSAKIMNGNLISKFGINDNVTVGEKEIRRLYRTVDFALSRYFNP